LLFLSQTHKEETTSGFKANTDSSGTGSYVLALKGGNTVWVSLEGMEELRGFLYGFLWGGRIMFPSSKSPKGGHAS